MVVNATRGRLSLSSMWTWQQTSPSHLELRRAACWWCVLRGSHTVRRRVQERVPHAHGRRLSSGPIPRSCWWEAQELPEVRNIRMLCGHRGPEMLVFRFQETMLLHEDGAQALLKPIGD